MSKRMRFSLILLFAVVGAFFLKPTITWYFGTSEERQTLANGSKEQIKDYATELAGEHLVELSELVKSSPDSALPEKFSFLKTTAKENYKLLDKDIAGDWTVKTVLQGFQDGNEVFRTMENHYRQDITELKALKEKALKLGLDLSGGMSIVIEADEASLAERNAEKEGSAQMSLEEAVSQAMMTLNNRIDKFGVTEPQIRKQGENQILIEIPGEADPERVNSFLMGKGKLNFHIVDNEANTALKSYIATHPGDVFTDGKPAEAGIIPEGVVVRGMYKKDSYGIDQRQSWIAIREEIGLSGDYIQNASVQRDQITNQPQVNFILDKDGGNEFFKLTTDNEGETMAVVLDDKIKSAARISEPIRESVRITGFDNDEAYNLALVLRTAAMPVELNVINQQAVGATLGEDSIQAGLKAIMIGLIAVMIFMVVYYKAAGLIADIALLLNFFFIISILSSFSMTLTLTSIAGLILNVGMAVDANVIIFERIKEELRMGKARKAAVEAGFKKAFWTIMDANITTFIAALFLSQLGKGPIQGFAVTLAVGIVSSVFTAIFVSHFIFDFGTDVLKRKKLSIGWGL